MEKLFNTLYEKFENDDMVVVAFCDKNGNTVKFAGSISAIQNDEDSLYLEFEDFYTLNILKNTILNVIYDSNEEEFKIETTYTKFFLS